MRACLAKLIAHVGDFLWCGAKLQCSLQIRSFYYVFMPGD